MRKTLALIHTRTFFAPIFTKPVKEQMPNVDVFNIVDEGLISSTIAAKQMIAELV